MRAAVTGIRYLLGTACLLFLSVIADIATASAAFEDLEAILEKNPEAVVFRAQKLLVEARKDGHLQHQMQLQYLLSRAWMILGDYGKALSATEAGAKLAERLGDDHLLARFLSIQAGTLMRLGNGDDQALELINQALDLARTLEEPLLLAELLTNRGQILMLFELDEMALQDFLKALKLYHQLPESELQQHVKQLNDLYNNLAFSNMITGNYTEALRLLKKIAASEAPNNHFQHAINTYNQGKVYLELEDYDKANEYFHKSETLSRRIGDKESLVAALSGQGKSQQKLGNLEKAIDFFKEGLGQTRDIQSPVYAISLNLDLADTYLQLGDIDKAQTYLQAANTLMQNGSFPSFEETAIRLQANIAARHDDYQQAYIQLKELLEARQNNLENERIKHAQILQARFSLILTEAENRLLQERSQRQSEHVMMLFITFAFITVVGGLIFLRERSLKRKMADVALTDELTKTANRRQILDLTRREMDRARLQGQKLSIAMVDLDNFKKINDRFGHDTGDQVLKLFAETGAKLIRQQDLMGRLGGEEWLFTFPNTTADNASSIIERLAQKYRDMGQREFPQIPELNFSAGIAEMGPDDQSLEQLIKRADQAMYQAKQQGRNRIILARQKHEN